MFVNVTTLTGKLAVRKSDIIFVEYDTATKKTYIGLGYNEVDKTAQKLEVKTLYTELVAYLSA